LFARLIFYGVTLLGRREDEVWLMPLGSLMDQWEIYKQFNGMAFRRTEVALWTEQYYYLTVIRSLPA
jgi:hypothetical protein